MNSTNTRKHFSRMHTTRLQTVHVSVAAIRRTFRGVLKWTKSNRSPVAASSKERRVVPGLMFGWTGVINGGLYSEVQGIMCDGHMMILPACKQTDTLENIALRQCRWKGDGKNFTKSQRLNPGPLLSCHTLQPLQWIVVCACIPNLLTH